MSFAVRTLVAVFLRAGSVMEKTTAETLQTSLKRSVMSGRVSRISSAVKTTAVFPDAGSATTTMTVETIQMKTSVCPGSAQRVSFPALAAAVSLADGSVTEIMIAPMDLMSTAVM